MASPFTSFATSARILMRPATMLVLLLLCLLPFSPGLNGPFQLDDASNIARMQLGNISLEAIYEAIFSNPSGLLRRPISNATFLLQTQLGAVAPFGFKLVNLILHGINGWLIWKLATRLMGLLTPETPLIRRQTAAFLAAAIWIVHPLQVSTALYVVQRMTLLSTTFMVIAVLLALKPLTVPSALPKLRDGLRHTLFVGALSLLAVACKENGALVPFLLLAIFLAMPRSVRVLATDSAGKRSFERFGVWLPCIAAPTLVFITWRSITDAYAGRAFTPFERLITECRILIEYVLAFVVPLPSRMGLYLDDTSLADVSTPDWLLSPFLVAATLLGAAVAKRKYPVLAFAAFWFLACHLLESTVVPLELKYEHRNYLALLGPALLMAWALTSLAASSSRRIAISASIGIIALLAGLTLMRSSDWSSEERFIVSELRHHPDSIRANMEAARLESGRSRNDAATARIQALQSRFPDAYAPLAGSLELGCAGYPVNWDALNSYIRNHPTDASIQNQALYATLAGYVHRGICTAGFEAALSRHLDAAEALYRVSGIRSGLQFFLMVKANMSRSERDRHHLLQRAVEADPRQTGPLIQLAYANLSLGDSVGTQAALRQLQENVPAWHPDRMYVRELERQVRQAVMPSSKNRALSDHLRQ